MVIYACDRVAAAGMAPGPLLAVAVALTFLGLPLWLHRRDPASVADPHGFGPGPLGRALAIGVLASVVVLLPFALGYGLVARHLWGLERRAWAVLQAPPLELHGLPAAKVGVVTVGEGSRGLQLRNGLDHPLWIVPRCRIAGCEPRLVDAGAAVALPEPAARDLELRDQDRRPIDADRVLLGAGSHAAERTDDGAARIRGGRSLGWLLWLLLDHLLVVALPEEAFFRGWMQRSLRRRWPPRRHVLGVPFGWAEVVAAALFAGVHLFSVPSPHRLAVFLPGLLFAWLAVRARHTGAAIVCHGASNVALAALQRLYL